MPTYNTRQRNLLMEYLLQHIDEQLSVKQIAGALYEYNISVSSVYRNLAALEKDGKIKRCTKSGNREIFYQYTDWEECKKHLHLSCKKCGKIVHLDADDTDLLVQRIAEKKNFEVASADTVLYGICENCQK